MATAGLRLMHGLGCGRLASGRQPAAAAAAAAAAGRRWAARAAASPPPEAAAAAPPAEAPEAAPPAFRAHIDFRAVRDNLDEVRRNAAARRSGADADAVAAAYDAYCALQQQTDDARAAKNANAAAMKRGGALDADARAALVAAGREIKARLEGLEARLAAADAALQREGQRLPNATHPDAPRGGEGAAATLRVVGAPPAWPAGFAPRDHLALGAALDVFDFDAAAAVSGTKFYYLKREAALLELALVSWSMHRAAAAGFVPHTTPDLVREAVLEKCGFQPRGANTQVYAVAGPEPRLCLTGTAEVPLGGLHMDDVLDEAALPLRLAGFGHCFRTEAGAAGAATRGLYRVHQFSKVEAFAVCAPHQSEALLQELVDFEAAAFEELGLHFRVLDMPTEDLGAPAYRKIDIEAWMPGLGRWGEVSSASNCTDYQARRLNIRYRPSGGGAGGGGAGKKGGATAFVHTLNATVCAVPRMIVALLETHQRPDGSVAVPPALRPYMAGVEELRPRGGV